MTIRTALLEARFLLGDRNLFDELVTRFDDEVVRNTGAQFVAAKLTEREDRHPPRRPVALSGRAERQGRQRRPARSAHFVLDREIRLSRSRAGRTGQARRFRQAGISTVPPLRGFPLVGALPSALRYRPRRGATIFDLQREIAVRLGYTEHPGMQDVERFMKHYFLNAKDVGDLTAIVCAELEDNQTKTVPVLSRVMDAIGRSSAERSPKATPSSSRRTASASSTAAFSGAIRST